MAVNKLKPIRKEKADIRVSVNRVAKPTAQTFGEKHSRAEILKLLSEGTGLSKVTLERVFGELKNVMSAHLRPSGSGEIILPFLGLKLKRHQKKATKERKMVSPLTGTEVTIAAKPASTTVKVTVLKALQDLVK